MEANITTEDARGRKIEIKKLKTLDRMRLFELIGSANAGNEPYLGHAMLAYSVVSIDGQPVPPMKTKIALEGVVQLLDDDGFNAVAAAVTEHFLANAPTPDEFKASVKNG